VHLLYPVEPGIYPTEVICERFLPERGKRHSVQRKIGLEFPVLASKSRVEFRGNVSNAMIVGKAGYTRLANGSIASDKEHSPKQLRAYALMLPSVLNADCYFTQDWKLTAGDGHFRRTA